MKVQQGKGSQVAAHPGSRLMEAAGLWAPPSVAGREPNRASPSTDSFKEDIQAIGRAVERLQEGFAADTSDSSHKSASGHDSLRWSRAQSGSTLGSGGESPHDREPNRLGGHRSPDALPLPIGETTAKSGNGSFAEEVAALPSALDRTSYSHGRLSLRELRSTEETRKLYSSERITRRGDAASSVSPERDGNGDSSLTQRRSTGARRDSGRPTRGSPGGKLRVVASAVTSEWKEEEEDGEGRVEARRRMSARVPSEHQPRPLLVDGQAGAFSSTSLPLRSPSSQPWRSDDVSEGGQKKRRDRSSEESGDDGVGSDRRSISGRKRRPAERRREGKGEREGDGGGGGAAEGEGRAGAGEGLGRVGEDSVGSSSLIELRDALRSREKDLLRLKVDVGAVATSAGSFKHLAASHGGGVKAGSSTGFGLYGGGDDDGGIKKDNRSKASPRGRKPHAGPDRDGASAGGDDGETPLKDTTRRSYRKDEIHGRSQSSPSPAKTTVHREAIPARGIDLLSDGAHAVSQALLSPSQQPLPTFNGAGVAVGGSNLVASAHGALKRMRAVLEQREVDAQRAKNDAGKMADNLSELSTRLHSSERKRRAQTTELTDAQAEISRLTRRAKETAEEQTALTTALRERDKDLTRLKEKLAAATGELSEEQEGTAALRERLEASERDTRDALERATVAEEEAAEQAARAAKAESAGRGLGAAVEKQIAELEGAVEERSADAQRAREEARSAVTGLRSAEEEVRQQAREAARAREQLGAERERSARVQLELEAALRERTHAVENLAIAEAEMERLRTDLAAALATAEDNQVVHHQRKTATEGLQAAEAELAGLRVTLALAREGEAEQRRRFEQESIKAAALRDELAANEARRTAQEEEISLVRKQVSRLDAKIEVDVRRERAKLDAAAKASLAEAQREAATLGARMETMETDLRATQQRERVAAEAAEDLKAELANCQKKSERAGAEAASALEQALAAEATADSQARSFQKTADTARRDKETLKRSLVASQAQAAELRAEYSRLLSRLDPASATPSFLSGRAGGLGDGATAALQAAVEAPGAAAGTISTAAALRMRAELEEKLTLALAESTEARTVAQRLKLKVKACEREHKPLSTAVAGNSARDRIEEWGASDAKQRQGLQESGGVSGGTGCAGKRELHLACRAMDRVASALCAAVNRTEHHGGGGRRQFDDTLGATSTQPRGRVAGGSYHSTALAGGRRRRRRALSAGSSRAGDDRDVDNGRFGDEWERGSEGDQRFISRVKVRELSERLRSEAGKVLDARADEREEAEEKVARLQQELRNSENREAEAAARLEESRELSREQTGFVEGVWQERRRLEAELGARREEVERLRAREDVTRAAAKALESRAEELSATLRQGQAQVKHDAQAAAAASTRDAMEALRRQLDELRREVDRTKQEQAANSSRPSAGGAGTGAAAAGAGSSGAASGLAPGVGGEVRSEGWGAATAAVVSSAVLEGEFQRLRAKYEKAKGRIAALEELVAVSRRVSTQTRKEFQGALDALKLSQELLLRIHRKRQSSRGGNSDSSADPPRTCEEASAPSTTLHNRANPAQRSHEIPSGAPAVAVAPEQSQPASLVSSSADAHAYELTTQASRLRDMSSNVKRLLQLAAGEVLGALEDTRGSLGAATSTADHARGVLPAVPGGKAAAGDPVAPNGAGLDLLTEQLRGANAVARALEADKLRLDDELKKVVAQLAECQEHLRDKTAQALVLEEQVARSDADRRDAREAQSIASNRLAGAESVGAVTRRRLESAEEELSHTRGRLDTALAVQSELRKRCEELALASSAFATEVAKQKEERTNSQERSRAETAASAKELQERCAEFSRASDLWAAERIRFQKELESARTEAQDIDSDVAQVLDALAASEKERLRLEGELDRQSRIAGAARRAAKVAEGTAAHAQKDVDRERSAFFEKTGQIEDAMQADTLRLKESLEQETKRREELERECKGLASRVTELEAALMSASSEVRKSARLAGERSGKHEREVATLREEATRLRTALREEAENARGALTRAEEGREKWMEERATIKKEASKDKRAALTEATERAYREGVADEQARLADAQERDRCATAGLQKDMEEMTAALQAEASRAAEALAREASLRAQAAREVASLKRKVARLETDLDKASAAASIASEAAREAANPMCQMQAEMRSVISSLQKDKEEKVREADARLEGVNRQWHASDLPGASLLIRQAGAAAASLTPRGEVGGDTAEGFSGFSVEHTSGQNSTGETIRPTALRSKVGMRNDDLSRRERGTSTRAQGKVRLAGGDVAVPKGATFGSRKGDRHVQGLTARGEDESLHPSQDVAAGRGSSAPETAWRRRQEDSLPTAGGITATAAAGHPRVPALQKTKTGDNNSSSSSSSSSGGGSSGGRQRSSGGSSSSSSVIRGRGEGAVAGSQLRRPGGPASDSGSPSPTGTPRQDAPSVAGRQAEVNHANDVDVAMDAQRPDRDTARSSRVEYSDDNDSCSATQSLESVDTQTSDLSRFLATATAMSSGREGGSRRSVVVRDWKAGQREAFSELDRRASASGGGGSVGVGVGVGVGVSVGGGGVGDADGLGGGDGGGS